MKKISTLKILVLAIFCVFAMKTKAQMTFSTNVSMLCVSQPTNFVLAQVTVSTTGTASYSWSILPSNCGLFLNASATSATFNISCAGTYTIYCSALNSSNQVLTTSQSTVLASTNPTLTATANPSIVCLGGSSTLVATGANSYTWNPGNVTGNVLVVTPSVSSAYNLIGLNSVTGCTSTAAAIVIVNPSPTITISASNNSVCAGQSATLIASGAMSYTWNPGPNTSQYVVSPLVSTCYSVIGANSMGCTQMTVHCINVQQGPSLNIASVNTVCLGSSATFTATGGTNYIWSTSATTNTINIMPTTFTTVSVSSTGANGCVGTATAGLFVNTACSDVWPGDANSDGVVSSTDVFEIGLGFSSTGSARTGASNTYVGQYANNWSGTVSSGKNLCHADCNGDGTINNADTVAIFNNFSLTHAFKPAGGSPNADVTLVAPAMAYVGIWNVADVMVGTTVANISQLYGLSFDLNFDVNLIDDAYLVYTPSFLSASNQNVQFRKNFISNGKVVAASVRTDKNNVSGNGKIAELHFKVKSGLAENTQLDFSVSNSQKISKDGILAPLVPGTLTQHATNNMVGLNKQIAAVNVEIFPNPVSNELSIRAGVNEEVSYIISDVSGRIVGSASFTGETKVDVSSLKSGVYFAEIQTSKGNSTQKVIINHQ